MPWPDRPDRRRARPWGLHSLTIHLRQEHVFAEISGQNVVRPEIPSGRAIPSGLPREAFELHGAKMNGRGPAGQVLDEGTAVERKGRGTGGVASSIDARVLVPGEHGKSAARILEHSANLLAGGVIQKHVVGRKAGFVNACPL